MTHGSLRRRLMLLANATLIGSVASQAVAAERRFSIPAQRLDLALAAFGRQSGVAIFYRPEMAATAWSSAVVGRLEPEAALTRLLAGSRTEFRRVEQGFTILPIAAPRDAFVAAPVSPRTTVAPGASNALPVAAMGGAATTLAEDRPIALAPVVVTGSFIRGIKPVGANLQSLDTQELQRMGSMSTNQILANVPIISNQFNTTASTPTSVFLNVFRPTIRNITASGGNTTLVLVDGHNQVGVGTLQTTADAGMIPPNALERVEILADGGSALYGADAVTGIINYITRTRFDGLEAAARIGYADGGYEAQDMNLTAGRIWQTGSAMIAVGARSAAPLYASARGRPRQDLTPWGGSDFRVRTCTLGNVTTGGFTYALPTLAPGTLNLCDTTAQGIIAPEERLYSAFTSVTKDLGPDLRFEMKGLWSDRIVKSRAAALVGRNLTIGANNPFFRPIAGETTQTVNFSFAPYLGPRQTARSEVKQYSMTPELYWDLPRSWQMRALYNHGWSRTLTEAPSLAPFLGAYLNAPGLTTKTALNPYDLLATDPELLKRLTLGYRTLGRATQTLEDFRVQADGPVFSARGGEARGAFGIEWQRSTLDALAGVPATGFDDPDIGRGAARREVRSVFGQLAVPLVGPANARHLMQSFILDLSARYDRYSDLGATPNPKIALSWKVTDGLALRGNWGTSFNAPSLGDTTGDSAHRAEFSATTVALAPGANLGSDGQRPSIAVTGGNPDLKPQKARTWSIGADVVARGFENLQFGVTYWSISVRDIVGLAPRADSIFAAPAFRAYYTLNPTLEQVRALVGDLPLTNFPTASLADLYGAGLDPYILIDVRKDNFGTIKAEGVDFRASFNQPVPWGSVFGSVTGTRPTKREQRVLPGGPLTSLLAADNSTLSVSTTLGLTVGRLTASATQNLSKGYALGTTSGQARIGDFAPVNLAFRYDLAPRPGGLDDMSLSLNVDNVADLLPPFLNSGAGAASGTGNGSTLGRYISLGLKTRF